MYLVYCLSRSPECRDYTPKSGKPRNGSGRDIDKITEQYNLVVQSTLPLNGLGLNERSASEIKSMLNAKRAHIAEMRRIYLLKKT